jgi:hypothetical protein
MLDSMPAGAAEGSVGAEILDLARRIESMAPVDASCVREHLHSLQCAMDRMDQWDAELGDSSTDELGTRLRSLVARISDDVAGGHVVAISGLERQVRCYLQRRTESRAERGH